MVKAQKYDDLSFAQRRILKYDYIVNQDNKCFYCKNLLIDGFPIDRVIHAPLNENLFPKGFLTSSSDGIHLQHDHSTGLTEGAVHARCNAYMWQYEGR